MSGIFDIGRQPWGRPNVGMMHCPFCGQKKLINGYSDISDDDLRLTIYCDNVDCEVREFTVIAVSIGRFNGRADVAALSAVDVGTDAEKLPEELNYADLDQMLQLRQHAAGRLGRRLRPTKITVEPVDD